MLIRPLPVGLGLWPRPTAPAGCRRGCGLEAVSQQLTAATLSC